jgi:hypothetical protein
MSKPRKQPFQFRTLETKRPAKGPRTTTVPRRYFAIPGTTGNPDETLDVCDVIPERNRGRVQVDLQNGEIVGVRIN